ncbi:MAG: LON peptidase substrate-binding domain-containing protein [Dehalococcoidia bacterium]|nr:LON peptidase substrate-binding domain-containing protein [Dehalococcoidia bacterium]
MARLPLFPLKIVLFPGMALPLHIFEERYKLMISRCIDERAPFGVVLVRSGEEVGGSAEPYDVGTTARVARVQRLPDGRLNLVALGDQRFRIAALDSSEPYLQGDVEFLGDEDVDAREAQEEAERVVALFAEQFRLVMAVTGQWVHRLELPDEPGQLADFVAAHVDFEPEDKQKLLETLSVPARLRREVDLLGDCIRQLTERWEERRRKKFAGAALN